MKWSFFTRLRRPEKPTKPARRLVFRPRVEALEDRYVLSPMTVVVAEMNSQLTLSGDVNGSPIREQGPGSLTTQYTGQVHVDVGQDDMGNLTTIQFLNDGVTSVNADISGNWQPLPGGGSGTAPANYGGKFTFFSDAFVAIREAMLGAASDALALVPQGDGQTYTFSSTQTLLINHGFADYQTFVASGRSDLSGNSGTNMAADGSLVDNQDGTYALTVPVHVTLTETVSGVPINLTIDGTITGTGTFDPPPFGPSIGGQAGGLGAPARLDGLATAPLPAAPAGAANANPAPQAAIGLPVLAELPRAAAFAGRIEQLDAVTVQDAQDRGRDQQTTGPVLTTGPLGQVVGQGAVIAHQPAVEGSFAGTFEGQQAAQGDQFAGVELGLGVLRRTGLASSTQQNRAMITSTVVMGEAPFSGV